MPAALRRSKGQLVFGSAVRSDAWPDGTHGAGTWSGSLGGALEK